MILHTQGGDRMVLSSRKDVEAFLEEMRAAIKFGKVNFINRSKNMNTLDKLGWMPEDAIDEIETLTYDEYKNGPEIDRMYPTSDKLWVFKKEIEGENFYIKLKVEHQDEDSLRVLSFHFDELP